MARTKWQIRIRSKVESGWTHLAYVPLEINNKFLEATKGKFMDYNQWLNKFADQDFGIKRVEFWEDLYELRQAVRDKYRQLYPELHLIEEDAKTDQYGWMRVWLVSHMVEEIKAYEREHGEITLHNRS